MIKSILMSFISLNTIKPTYGLIDSYLCENKNRSLFGCIEPDHEWYSSLLENFVSTGKKLDGNGITIHMIIVSLSSNLVM